MAETIFIDGHLTKKEKYEALMPQLVALTAGERDVVANMANITAALKETFDFFWIGFYIVRNSNGKEMLVLGPFQGPVACVRIEKGKGVCGSAWESMQTILVDDVEKFPGHIACNALSRSEIVVPVIQNNIVTAILDVDSKILSGFDEVDKEYLGRIADLIASIS